jgi:hypothetical protein
MDKPLPAGGSLQAPCRSSNVAVLLRPLIGLAAGHACVCHRDRDAERHVAKTRRRW